MQSKPKVSSGSRIYDINSRYARKQRQAVGEPKEKKTAYKDVGKLTQILNMPMDVFYEVTSHLTPLDILQLARSSRDLRSMLLSRTSRHIWIAARRNADPPLPDLPDPEFMSEPFYAHLVYERICNACGVNQSVNVDYGIPGRFCGPCWKANVDYPKFLFQGPGLKKDAQAEICSLLPNASLATTVWKGDPTCDVDKLLRAQNIYYEPEIQAVMKQYRELQQGKDKQALHQFVDDRKARASRRLEFHKAMVKREIEMWGRSYQVEQPLKEERVAAIEQKLQELGYDRSEYPLKKNHPFYRLMNQPRKVTPQTWDAIRPKLVAILDNQRQQRAKAEFYRQWRKRLPQFIQHYQSFVEENLDQDGHRHTLPGFEDALPLFLDILTGPKEDVDVTPEEFAAADAAVLAHADEYRLNARHGLATLVHSARAVAAAPKVSKKGKANKGKGKQKETVQDTDVDEKLDAAADLVLLDEPTSLFICRESDTFRKSSYCELFKTHRGMLEHWQHAHFTVAWSAENIECVLATHPQIPGEVECLVAALGLPRGASLSTIETVIGQGRPECTCGYNLFEQYDEQRPRYILLHKLLKHVNGERAESQVDFEHRITMKHDFEDDRAPSGGTV